MTVRNSHADNHIQQVEIARDQIIVYFRDGNILIDDDVATEDRASMPSVDFFINSTNSPNNNQVIVRNDENKSRINQFLNDASRWGPIRDRLAEKQDDDLQSAQRRFNLANMTAQLRFSEFQEALIHKKVFFENGLLFYKDPRGDKVAFHISTSGGPPSHEPLRIVSFYIEDGGSRFLFSDPVLLKPISPHLNQALHRQKMGLGK